jgi:hypothetical protein
LADRWALWQGFASHRPCACDLAGSKQRPEQHGGCVRRWPHGLRAHSLFRLGAGGTHRFDAGLYLDFRNFDSFHLYIAHLSSLFRPDECKPSNQLVRFRIDRHRSVSPSSSVPLSIGLSPSVLPVFLGASQMRYMPFIPAYQSGILVFDPLAVGSAMQAPRRNSSSAIRAYGRSGAQQASHAPRRCWRN